MEKSTTIVIPNFNGRELLLQNLPKVVEAKNNIKNKILEIIVVDDGSSDDSIDVLRNNFKEVVLYRHKKNRGFPAAVNTGVRQAKGKYVVLLNSDVVPSVDFLEKVYAGFEEKLVFAICIHTSGYGGTRAGFEDGYVVYKPKSESRKTENTFFANGGGSIFVRELWLKIGGMDELLYSPYYWEDVDLSYRALKRGYKILWSPNGSLSPNISATMAKLPRKKVQRIQERNHLLFVWKNLTSQPLFKKHLFGLVSRLIKHPGYVVPFLMALSKFSLVTKKRYIESKEEKVSDEAILFNS